MRRLAIAVCAALVSLSSPTSAQDAIEKSGVGNADKDGKVRKDPKGIKGISPYNELLAEGRAAVNAGDMDIAIAAFKKATLADPENLYGYVLLAQAYVRKGDDKTALEVADSARTKQGDAATRGKLHFLRAELLERAANTSKPEAGKTPAPSTLAEALAGVWDKAKEGWQTLKVYLEANTELPDRKETAVKRMEEVDKRVKREKDYGAVRERIDKNAAERAKATK